MTIGKCPSLNDSATVQCSPSYIYKMRFPLDVSKAESWKMFDYYFFQP